MPRPSASTSRSRRSPSVRVAWGRSSRPIEPWRPGRHPSTASTELVHRLAGSPRAAGRAERWLAQADGASESVGETRARLLLLDLGHDVRSQVRISDDAGSSAPGSTSCVGDRVVVEFDGLVKYEGAEGRAALAAEKRREDWLRSLGYEVVRLTWADLGARAGWRRWFALQLERAAHPRPPPDRPPEQPRHHRDVGVVHDRRGSFPTAVSFPDVTVTSGKLRPVSGRGRSTPAGAGPRRRSSSGRRGR